MKLNLIKIKAKKALIVTSVCVVVGSLLISLVLYLKYKSLIDASLTTANSVEAGMSQTSFMRAGSSLIYDDSNNLISKVTGNDFKYDKLAEVSKFVPDGYISVEDKSFMYEGGINYFDSVKAALLYIENNGTATVGGSTITQQLVKNVFLTQSRTVSRKLPEILIARYVDKIFSKQQILEFYVNNCYFGEGCYGIEGAAQHYFSKPASDLTLAESATLCGVSNNPTLFSPTKNPKNSTARRNIVLNSMLVQNKITQAQYNEAKNEVLTLNIKKSVVTPENYMTSYAIDCVVREMMQQDAFKFQYIFSSDDVRKLYESQYQEEYLKFDKQVRSGGYQIYTSLNTSKQTELQNDVDSNLASFTDVDPKTNKCKMQGAAVSIDNQTGYVVAIVGGRGTSDIFNRAFLSFRQPGSSIKPVLDYAPAFDKGFHPLSQINDSYIENGPVNDTHSYQGPVTIRYATEVSINTVAFKVLENVNPVVGLNYLAKMQYAGIYPEDNTPIVAIGGFTSGVTPVEQAGGYFALENNGYYEQPSCVKQVKYINSQVIYTNPRTGVQVYTPESAYMMTDVLKGVISSDDGTGAALKIPGQIVAGKTGSTDQSKDGWFCGYSKYYTTAVWCGYDIPEPISSLYGNSYPGHIWLDYMTAIHRDLPQLDFDKPAGIVLKNIDDNGNMVAYNSGQQDMFSQPLLDKLAEAAKEESAQEAAVKQQQWDAAEPAREAKEEVEVVAYENASYTDVDSLHTIDQIYTAAVDDVKNIDNLSKKQAFMDRINAKYLALDSIRNQLQHQLADQKALEAAKAEASAETDAEQAVSTLEGLTAKSSADIVNLCMTDAQDKVSKVTDATKQSEFNQRISVMQVALGRN